MRLAASAMLALLAGCGDEASLENGRNAGHPAVDIAAPPMAAPAADGAAAPDIPNDAALADMSPRQRRAYELGFRDCSAGRYEPDPHPEAYRIGCGAAQETRAGRPEG